MAVEASSAALPYHEPNIVTILILSSFVLLLNVVNHVIDKVLYCGLLGQIALGMAWGTPGGKWLGQNAEEFIVNFGYLGLLLLVYEGGLLTSFGSLKANLLLSSGVAATGIALPIGLSYVLMSLSNTTPLQAFAAGAALCSTSLGTTFAIMSSSGLISTRMGVVLTSAAMMDDVVGLVMVQVISNLGGSSGSFDATTIVRPVLVSIAFAVIVPLVARFVVKPMTIWLNELREQQPQGVMNKAIQQQYTALLIHTLILIAMITATNYAGTSSLFAAYLSGAAITWWDVEVPHTAFNTNTGGRISQDGSRDPQLGLSRRSSIRSSRSNTTNSASTSQRLTGVEVFETFYAQALNRILKPFFFASIGFSIPISRMFSGEVVWKGIVYSVLMFVAKLVCGLWLVRIPYFQRSKKEPKQKRTTLSIHHEPMTGSSSGISGSTNDQGTAGEASRTRSQSNQGKKLVAPTSSAHPPASPRSHHTPSGTKPLSLYPGIIVGCAMVARGEIGFLISALAESNGIFGDEPDSPIFLEVTWAIILCTILGPILVGTLVKRVKRLQSEAKRGRAGERRDVLGVWGVD